MEKYQEIKGRKVYYVFPAGTKDAVSIVARETKTAASEFKMIPVYLDGEDLYLEPGSGEKAIAVVKR